MRYAILRTQKLKSAAAVRRTLLHAFREQETPNADPARLSDNTRIGANCTSEALDRFNARLATQPKLRSNAVLCIEYLITASSEALHGRTREEQDAYFNDALAWLRERHGEVNVVCACIHRDETTPHVHAYVVPLDSRGKLNCRSFLGGASALREMQTAFAKRVAASHGLERGVEGSRAHHQSVRRFYGRLEAVADDPRLKPMQMIRFEQLPPEPSLMDKLNGSAEPMKKARALALAQRARNEEHNRQAVTHNRRRAELLEQLAGRGLARQVDQQERSALANTAVNQAMRAAATERAFDLVSATARKRADEIKKLKAERDDQEHLVQNLIDELVAASPGRARELGLIKLKPELKPTQREPQLELDNSLRPSGP